MRIIGGRFRGRAIRSAAGETTRPTADRLRERVFDVLTHWQGQDVVRDARVIDLFAGTGALGLEALSRGAQSCLFVEDGTEARAVIRENIEMLGVGGATRIFRRDATKLGAAPAEPFTLAFLDPPYGRDLASAALRSLLAGGWLAAGATVVVEEAEGAPFTAPDGLAEVDLRHQGDTLLRILVLDTGERPTRLPR